MKSLIKIRTYFHLVGIALVLVFTSCEQEYFEPNTTVAPGGGTVTTYKAYTLGSMDPGGANVYGRVVFYKYSASVTLVQMGLYNTDPEESYVAEIFNGKLADGSTTISKTLDDVSGATGAFATSKFFTISDATFFEALDAYNANVKVSLGAAAVAAGDIGTNADPVAQQD